MGITNVDAVERDFCDFIEEQYARVRKVLIRNMLYLGERCITIARIKGSYEDQTGNLRSSIGYILIEDGNIINISSFDKEKQGDEGVKEGKSLVLKLAKRYRKGLVLIIVAGMNYATYVAKRGKDVTESAELFAEAEAPKILSKIGFK